MRAFRKDRTASAVSFILAMLIIGLIVFVTVQTLSSQMLNASQNATLGGSNFTDPVSGANYTGYGIPGGPQLLLIIVLLFILIPVVIFARAAS